MLAEKMKQRLQPYVDGDRAGFRMQARSLILHSICTQCTAEAHARPDFAFPMFDPHCFHNLGCLVHQTTCTQRSNRWIRSCCIEQQQKVGSCLLPSCYGWQLVVGSILPCRT